MFGNGLNGMINAPDPNKYYSLSEVSIATPHPVIQPLYRDFELIRALAKELDKDSQGAADALAIGNRIINVFRVDMEDTWEPALKIAREFLERKGIHNHHFTAIGNW